MNNDDRYTSFSANKDEIYSRNMQLAQEELEKERAEEERSRAEQIIKEYRNIYSYTDAEQFSPEIEVPSFMSFIRGAGDFLRNNKKLIYILEALIVAAAAVSFIVKLNRMTEDNAVREAAARGSAVREVYTNAAADGADGEASGISVSGGRLAIEEGPFSMGLHNGEYTSYPQLYDVTFLFDLTNTGDEEYSFIEEDLRLKYGKYNTIAPSEIYTPDDESFYLIPGYKLSYAATYVVSEENIYNLTGFSYTKHPKADYAANDYNTGYITNFDIDISSGSCEFILSTAESFADQYFDVYYGDDEPYDDDAAAESPSEEQADAAGNVRNTPQPFEETAGAYVYTTDKMSFRFTASSEVVYVDSEPFTNKVTVKVEARNLAQEERWIFAENFYFSDGAVRERIRKQEGYNEETAHFTARNSAGERSPIAFGFDSDGCCNFTLIGFIPVENEGDYNIFGYDSTIGWASSKSDMPSAESFEFPLDKIII